MADHFLKRKIVVQDFKGTEIHYAEYSLKHSRDPGLRPGDASLDVPCRSSLHHLLTGLFYNWDWDDESEKQVTEEEAGMLKHIFRSQTEYSLWKSATKKLREEGPDKARQWLIDQIKVLAMRNLIKGK